MTIQNLPTISSPSKNSFNPILEQFNFAKTSGIVSRVTRYISYPDKTFPVSCTAISVEDSYFEEGDRYNFFETISGSRVYLTKVIKGNAGCLIDLSKLRPKGTLGSNNLIAEGVTNFLEIYSAINKEVTRGSTFKRGAVVLSLDYQHPDIFRFLDFPSDLIPYAKRAVTVDEQLFRNPKYSNVKESIINGLAAGIIFVNKRVYNEKKEELLSNVCTSIRLKSRSTCSLLPINLGMITDPNQIPKAFEDGAYDIIKIWNLFYKAKLEQGGHFLDPNLDKQAGLGLMGLANMLASFYISYKDFAASMAIISGLLSYDDPRWGDSTFNGRWIAFNFKEGYQRAASIAKKNKFERFFAIEPTASISYNSKDINGFTVTPEISPPVCHPETKVVRRQNDEGFEEFQYPPNVEVAEKDVDWQTYDLLCESFQKMQSNTGLAHGTNYNWWLCKPLTDETFDNWFKSPLLSIYYRWNTAFGVEDKTNIGVEVSEESEEFWGLDALDVFEGGDDDDDDYEDDTWQGIEKDDDYEMLSDNKDNHLKPVDPIQTRPVVEYDWGKSMDDFYNSRIEKSPFLGSNYQDKWVKVKSENPLKSCTIKTQSSAIETQNSDGGGCTSCG